MGMPKLVSNDLNVSSKYNEQITETKMDLDKMFLKKESVHSNIIVTFASRIPTLV